MVDTVSTQSKVNSLGIVCPLEALTQLWSCRELNCVARGGWGQSQSWMCGVVSKFIAHMTVEYSYDTMATDKNQYDYAMQLYKDLKNIKNVERCRDGMPKSMQTR